MDHKPQSCDRCHQPITKVFLQAPVGLVSNYAPYKCPVTDKIISGKKAHEENLKQHGCRVLEKGDKEDAARRRQQSDAALDQAVEETVEKEILAMPCDKREQLGKELSSGLDATVERH
jgi:hypothetical protein